VEVIKLSLEEKIYGAKTVASKENSKKPKET